MRTLCLVVAVSILAGCKAEVNLGGATEQVKVDVDCETVAGPAVNCDVKQTLGKSEVEACWDFSVTCNNGTKITPPRSCAKVKDGATTKHTITADKLANADKCDGGPKAEVTNLTINGKPVN